MLKSVMLMVLALHHIGAVILLRTPNYKLGRVIINESMQSFTVPYTTTFKKLPYFCYCTPPPT